MLTESIKGFIRYIDMYGTDELDVEFGDFYSSEFLDAPFLQYVRDHILKDKFLDMSVPMAFKIYKEATIGVFCGLDDLVIHVKTEVLGDSETYEESLKYTMDNIELVFDESYEDNPYRITAFWKHNILEEIPCTDLINSKEDRIKFLNDLVRLYYNSRPTSDNIVKTIKDLKLGSCSSLAYAAKLASHKLYGSYSSMRKFLLSEMMNGSLRSGDLLDFIGDDDRLYEYFYKDKFMKVVDENSGDLRFYWI